MNTFRSTLVMAAMLAPNSLTGTVVTYTNFIRQVQVTSGVEWDVQVALTGQQLSPLSIDPGGARFELWTVQNVPLESSMLDSKYVGAYVPQAWATIRTEDPYGPVPRTRADRPFTVDITVSGMLTDDPTAPEAATKVKLMHFAQSYGVDGTGQNLDRSQAVLLGTANVVTNGLHALVYDVIAVPGADRAKVRGEERFTVHSLADYQTPEQPLASAYVQIWPVADASITGLTNNQLIQFALPEVMLQLNDLYPSSYTYAQVYAGAPQLGTSGAIIPGSAVVLHELLPQSRSLTLVNWDAAISGDGQWTMEIVTETPFGVERLAYITFVIDRTIEINGAVTSLE